ncbi:MAG TPA: SMP-30/gluconolactonase/LRE family protein [Acidimicrobiales bacterium]|nr:SMP-30/gluconolactonase/LRE family protein [Acidimicrobiales bacterium]
MQRALLAQGFKFVEGPRWHDGRLVFSDMGSKQVLTVDLRGEVEEVCVVGGRPSGIGWLPDGRMLVVSMIDRRIVRLEPDGTLTEHADLSDLASAPCNDMVVDGRGNAYVGNPGYDMRNPPSPLPAAEVVLVRPDGSAQVVDRSLLFPNGPAVTPDGRTLVVAETIGSRLSAFDIAEDGTLSNRRVYADLPGRSPDGIALDAEGAVWVADASGNACVRVREGGEIADVVDTGRGCYACALGGSDRTTLFLLTGEGFSGAAMRKRTGAIETVEVAVAGAGLP